MENYPYNSNNPEFGTDQHQPINEESNSTHPQQSQNQAIPKNQNGIQGTHNTAEDVEPASNMIELLDGTLIQGYPIEEGCKQEFWKGLSLDTTGQYFTLSSKKPKQMNPREAEALEAEKFFVEHAFFFLANAGCILSDSRMFLAPVAVHNGIAYTGISGFTAPTLGIYIQWWLNTPVSIVTKKGRKYLTWHIAGSPLSGSNRCSIVDEQGKSHIHSFCGFSKLWRSFVEINTRYQPYKGNFEAYTLQKVYELLIGQETSDKTQYNTTQNGPEKDLKERNQAKETNQKNNYQKDKRKDKDKGRDIDKDKEKIRSLEVDCFFLRGQCETLATELSKKEKEAETLRSQLTLMRIECHKEELESVYRQYIRVQEDLNVRREALYAQRIVLRQRLRSGELSSKDFQKQVGPINKELNDIKYGAFHEFDHLPEQYHLGLSDIIDYFSAEDCSTQDCSAQDSTA